MLRTSSLLIFLFLSSSVFPSANTGARKLCELVLAASREKIAEAVELSRTSPDVAMEQLAKELEPALQRYSAYYHRLEPRATVEQLRALALASVRSRAPELDSESPNLREKVFNLIGTAMRREYRRYLDVPEHETLARKRTAEAVEQLTGSSGKKPTDALVAVVLGVGVDYVRRHAAADALAKVEASPKPVLEPVDGERQLEAISKAKGATQNRDSLALLTLELRRLKLNDRTMAAILNREGMPTPPGEGAWTPALIQTLRNELKTEILAAYPPDALASRGTQNRAMAELSQRGFSNREIAVIFEGAKVPSPKGGTVWSHTTVGRRLEEHRRGVFVRTNVPETRPWHSSTTEAEMLKWVTDYPAEGDVTESAIVRMRNHGWSLAKITEFANANPFLRGEGEYPWNTSSVNSVVHRMQGEKIEAFLKPTDEPMKLSTVREWVVQFDSLAMPPREIELLVAHRAPHLASSFTDLEISQFLASSVP